MSVLKQVLVCLVLIAAAAVGWYAYQNPHIVGFAREAAGSAKVATEASGGGGIPGLLSGNAVNVITAPVKLDEGGETVAALGTAKAARSVTLYPEVSGIVAEVLFRPGEQIGEGAPLLRLQDDEQRVAVDRANVALKQARSTLERSQALAKSKTISTVALSDAETAVALAEIELRGAEIELRRRTISAPFAGVIGLTDVSRGDYVTTSLPIATLDDLSTVRIGFEVPERWAGRIAEGHPIAATAQALPGAEFAGRIAAIDNRIDATTRTLRLEAELANEGRALKAGMAIGVGLTFETDQELMVPSLAVQWDRSGSFVWKVADGAARRADVAIVRRHSGVVTVRGELTTDDRVVVEGTQRLREGARVADVTELPGILESAPDEDAAPGDAGAPAMSGAGAPQRARS